MEDPSRDAVNADLERVKQLSSELGPGLVKDELDLCIKRINERIGGDVYKVFQYLNTKDFNHTPSSNDLRITNVEDLVSKFYTSNEAMRFVGNSGFPISVERVDDTIVLSRQKERCVIKIGSGVDFFPKLKAFLERGSDFSQFEDPTTYVPAIPSFDADRLPGPSLGPGGNLMGPQYFNRRREDRNPFTHPPGARIDPFGPVGSNSNRAPHPLIPRPNPDYLPKPDFDDMFYY